MTTNIQEKKSNEYYTVELNVNIPVTFTFKILADSEETAENIILNKFPNLTFSKPPRLDYSKVVKKALSVFKNGYLVLTRKLK